MMRYLGCFLAGFMFWPILVIGLMLWGSKQSNRTVTEIVESYEARE
jgi:hypothetical protein